MTFRKDLKLHFIALPLLFSFFLSCTFTVKAEELETEIQTDIEDTKSQTVVQGNEENLEDGLEAKEAIVTLKQKTPETIVFGTPRRQKHVQSKKLRRKDNNYMGGIEDGMVLVEGEELIVSELPEKPDIPQHAGVGRNMLTVLSEGVSRDVNAAGTDISLISFDSSQQQGNNDIAAQALVDWFLANLRDSSSTKDKTPLIGIEKYYQVPSH